MQIVHLSCVAPPQIGGIGRVAAVEVGLLKQAGEDAVLLAPETRGGGVAENVKRVKTRWTLGNAAALDEASLMPEIAEADVVHLHYPFYGTAGLVAKLRRQNKIKRLVMTLHMDAQAPGVKGWIFNLHRRMFQPKLLQAADKLIVSSLDYAEHSSFASQVKERGPDVVELPFGVDETKFFPSPSSEPLTAHCSLLTPVILFVGGMDKAHAFKGVDVLLKAMVKIADANLVLVGDGALRPAYEKLAAELGVASRCRFVGALKEDDLVAAYQGADVLAFPSISGAEAFGLVAIEAQSCGKPVVASDLPGVRTVILDGETGFLVPAHDHEALATRLSQILKDPNLRSKMGESARQRVLEKYTLKKHIESLIAIYESLR